MAASSSPQVLIIGAGPTGLATAAFLTQLGISVRIVDKAAARSDKSKALGVQAGTLECLAHALGPELPQKMVAAGRPAREAWIHVADQKPIRANLSTIPSIHDYILILDQSETERLLEEKLATLGVQVERSTELTALTQTDRQVQAQIRHSSGRTESVTTEFAIGCDGAHSVTRRLLEIPFDGAPYDGEFILGDVTLDWEWPYDSIQVFVNARGVIASFPLTGHHRYRLILMPGERTQNKESADIGIDEFRAIVLKQSKGEIRVLDATWLTRFRVSHRMVNQFQKGRAFLAGDAAHIHSPAGGQGMNTGIQDGFNLAHKMKRVLDGASPFESLQDYERERIPVARGVLRGTDFAFKMALLRETPPVAFLRRWIMRPIIRTAAIQKRVIRAISEVDVARREISRASRNALS